MNHSIGALVVELTFTQWSMMEWCLFLALARGNPDLARNSAAFQSHCVYLN